MHTDCKIRDFDQGTPEWHAARNGLITASEMKLLLTPTLKPANNDKSRAHIYELAAQRISGWTEPTYLSDDMIRGQHDEELARQEYSEHWEPVEEIGFITREIDGVAVGYSPDGAGIMGGFGIEIKSRRQKFHVKTVVDNEVPPEHLMQVQFGLWVTGWDYIDFINRCAGLPLWVVRSEPIQTYQDAIHAAVMSAEDQIKDVVKQYHERIDTAPIVVETEREEEMETEVYFDQ